MKNTYQIAIDGPAGAGKSTIAKAIARRLGILYVDTGAMYRAIAYKANTLNLPLDQEQTISDMAWNTDIVLKNGEDERVLCDGKDVTEEIRSPEVTRAVSIIAAYPKVRERLVAIQRRKAQEKSVVMDGRDIGTYVLPQADLKIFLTASLEERSKRRWLELQQRGKKQSLESVQEDIINRDRLDRERKVSPLVPADDAYILDTTGLSIEEIVEDIVNNLKTKVNL
ncbi:MAG: (d)CMP kinase [Desulfitobacterium sp.]|nr:(d)CMP kinase [Desulfitobacterium sp.]